MIKENIKLPLYAKSTLILVGLFALVATLYIARGIIIPFVFALIIAVVLHPVQVRIEKWGVHRMIAILAALILLAVLLGDNMSTSPIVKIIPLTKKMTKK